MPLFRARPSCSGPCRVDPGSAAAPRRVRRFLREREGSIAVEAVLLFPVLVAVFVLSFSFFDMFRTQNTNAKAAFAVADLLSRQTTPVTQAYLDGMADVYAALAGNRHVTGLRIASIDWSATGQAYRIRWARGTHGGDALTAEELGALAAAGRLPTLAPGETIILVETVLDYTPALKAGMPPRTFSHVIPARPRFVPRLVLADATS